MGNGLSGIQERVEELGGFSLDISFNKGMFYHDQNTYCRRSSFG